jgi:hypothetical protein
VTLFTLDGTRVGNYTPPAGNVLSYVWMPDSSAILAWSVDQNAHPGPAVILDRHGRVTVTGLQGVEPTPSPDSAWIAAGLFDDAQREIGVQIVPHEGGTVRTIVRGENIRLLGWLDDRIVYSSQGIISCISVAGDAQRKLGTAPGSAGSFIAGNQYNDSPDGKVVILNFAREPQERVTDTGVFPVPSITLPASPVYWTGPHTALGQAQDTGLLVMVDLLTGQSSLTKFAGPNGPIQAISGAWIVWSVDNGSAFEVGNIVTGRTHMLGTPPTDQARIAGMTQGKFLFIDSSDKTYLVDAEKL